MDIRPTAQRILSQLGPRRWFLSRWTAVGLLTALGILGLSLGGMLPAWSTAPMPPRLVPAILNGNPIHVLYVTRSNDTVLVRCYPGFQPSLELINQEGRLTCVNPDP
ncbi:MAG: hypothetical protein ACHWZW_07155 [Spirulina sp.]